MSDALERTLHASAPLRRLGWRVGRRLYCAARGEPHRNAIASNGEAYVQACVVAALPATAALTALDIGANEGEWTLSLLDALSAAGRGSQGTRIRSFEPVPATLARLRSAVDRHELGRLVSLQPVALSDTAARVEMTIMSATGGTNTLHGGGDAPATGSRLEIQTITLDAFCAQEGIARIHLAKADTEGHDARVLRGAHAMLTAGRIDVFQFEYNHRWVFARSFLKDVFDMIAGLDYVAARITPDSIELLPAWHPELERFFEANYVLVRRPALAWFTVRHGQFDGSNTYA